MSRAGPRIAAVDAFVVVGDKDYVAAAGLGAVAADGGDAGRGGRRALADVGDLHVCAYPPQAQTCLVRLTAEDGTVGWGEGHAPLHPVGGVLRLPDGPGLGLTFREDRLRAHILDDRPRPEGAGTHA
jgi:hypothetical protein